MSAPNHAELLILGCGPAGYSAAVYAARAHLRPILVTGVAEVAAVAPSRAESRLSWAAVDDVAREPGLKQRLRDHAEQVSTRVVFDRVKSVSLSKRPFRLHGHLGAYTCDALIVAIDGPLETQLFDGQLDMRDGRIVTHTGLSGTATMTSRRGVFVAGDVGEHDNAQVITGAGTACMAALDAQRFLGL